METERKPTPPGEVIEFNYLRPLNIKKQELALALGIHRNHLNRILKGEQALTFELAVKLAGLFETEPGFFIQLNANYDAWRARELLKEMAIRPIIEMIENNALKG